MINYSIFPPEVIFSDHEEAKIEYEELNIENNITLIVERINKKKVKIIKVISTDPQIYLKPGLKPDSILKSSLQLPLNK